MTSTLEDYSKYFICHHPSPTTTRLIIYIIRIKNTPLDTKYGDIVHAETSRASSGQRGTERTALASVSRGSHGTTTPAEAADAANRFIQTVL